jgi:hypothetical protein
MRVTIHFAGDKPSRETNHEVFTVVEALSDALEGLSEDEQSLVAVAYVYPPGSEKPTVVKRVS